MSNSVNNAVGNTTTVLSTQIIANAKSAINSYAATTATLYDELNTLITNLGTDNFIGEAADGYKVFFTTQVTPALTENLYQGEQALTANINALLDTIEQQLLRTVDPQLGENNQNPGGQG